MFSRRLGLILLAIVDVGCRKQAPAPRPRYAVVRFENLTGDASLDWAGRAASEVLSVSLSGAMDGPVLNGPAIGREAGALGGRPAHAPGISAEKQESLLAGATRIVYGYFEKVNGGLRFTAVTAEPGAKVLRTDSAEAATPLAGATGLAHKLSPSAKAYLTASEDALRMYSMAVEDNVARSEDEMREAVRIDPRYGPAWVGLARIRTLRGNRDGAESAIAEALEHKPDPVTAANLAIETARLKNDGLGVIAAERRLSDLSPGDTVLLRALAEQESAEGQFAAAASDWQKLAETLLSDPSAWNSLAYARSWAGDYAGAMKALETYGKLRPQDPNVQDSTGDVDYTNGRFAEAANRYLDAWGKDPSFLRGGDLYKAAWAKFRAGDKSGADAQFERFREERSKSRDVLFPLIEADWLYRTGRAPAAMDLLRQAVENPAAAPTLRSAGYTQLAIWDLLSGNRAKAKADSDAAGRPSSPPAVIVWFAVLPSAGAEEWQVRSDRMIAGPALTGVRRAALGYALLLDGKKKEALPVWRDIAKVSPATDFFLHALAARLEGQPVRPLPPDPLNVNPFGALIDQP